MESAEHFKEMVKQVLMNNLEISLSVDSHTDNLEVCINFDGEEIDSECVWIGYLDMST